MTIAIYKITNHFPDLEKFGLISQIRRCAVSIPSNIAEGSGRGTPRDFETFLNYSTGSSFELETQLIIASKLGYIEESEFKQVTERLQSIQKRIYSFKETLKGKKDKMVS